jgi:hypothetical protein
MENPRRIQGVVGVGTPFIFPISFTGGSI